VLLARGDARSAAREIGRAEPSWGRFLSWASSAERGAAARVRRQLDLWLAGGDGTYVAPYWLAERCVWAGRLDAAVAQLERALSEQQVQLLYVSLEPTFLPLRSVPRFRRLLAEIRRPATDLRRPPPAGAASL
jgi:hypothetical protein